MLLSEILSSSLIQENPVHETRTQWPSPDILDRLVGLLVKASASRAEDPGLESRLRQDFSWSSHTSDFKIGTPVATLPGAWRYRVSPGTGWPVSAYCDWVR